MKKNFRHILRRALLLALPLACAAVLSSCFGDESGVCPACEGDAPATVRIRVSAGELGDLNGTRAPGDKVEGDDHEFMNTLYVYIMDRSGNLVMDFTNPIDGDAAAAEGNLRNWQSGDFTLAPGTYTVYAFANIDPYEGTDGNDNQTGLGFLTDNFVSGASVSDDFYRFRLLDPASKIDFGNGMFIPMSAKETVTVASADLNAGAQLFSIGLDRLVSKVQVTVNASDELSSNCTVKFSGCSENVPLMAEADNELTGTDFTDLYGERKASASARLGDLVPAAGGGEEEYSLSFYVNETPDGAPFNVSLSTVSGNTYNAVTERNEMPRNHIFPLALVLNDYGLTLSGWYSVAPIGHLPVRFNLSADDFGEPRYTVKIPEGAQFGFTIDAFNHEDTPLTDNPSATWRIPSTTADGFTFTGATDNTPTVEGYVTAVKGLTFPFYVDVEARDASGNDISRTFTVNVETTDLTDVDFSQAVNNIMTRGTAIDPKYVKPEVLNMLKK